MNYQIFWKKTILPNLSSYSKSYIVELLDEFKKYNTDIEVVVDGKSYQGTYGYEIDFLQNYLKTRK
jgi:Fe-S cluster assembly iron-binding protein IscA